MAPAAAAVAFTATCMLGSHSVSVKRQAAITAAYTLSETALKDHKEAVKEIFGKKKAQDVQDKISVDKFDKGYNPEKNYIIMTGNGEYLCYDAYSGRAFRSSIEKVQEAINLLNHNMTMGSTPYCSLNEYYMALDIPELPKIKMGDDLGWSTSNLIEVSTTYSDIKGEPCMIIDFLSGPTPFYNELY